MKAIQLNIFRSDKQLDFYCQDGYMKVYGEDAVKVAGVIKDLIEIQDGLPYLSISVIRRADIVFPKLVRAGYYIKVTEL